MKRGDDRSARQTLIPNSVSVIAGYGMTVTDEAPIAAASDNAEIITR